MKNKEIFQLIFAVFLLLPATALFAATVDSSVELPPMTAVALHTKTAWKIYGDYLSSRKRENEIFAEFNSPDFAKLPYSTREIKRANNLVELKNISRSQKAQLKAYKEHSSKAMAALAQVGPGQLAGAQAQLEGTKAAMAKDLARQAEAAGALADAARLGLTPEQRKQFGSFVDQLKRKQGMGKHLKEAGKKLEGATASIEGLLGYMEEINGLVDLALIETDIKDAMNTGAILKHTIELVMPQISGGAKGSPDQLFSPGPDYSQLLSGGAAGQAGTVEVERPIEDDIREFGRP